MNPLNLSLDISLNSTFDLDFGRENFATKNAESNIESLVTDEFIDLVLQFFLKHNLSLVGLEDEMKLLNAKKAECRDLPTQKKQIIELFRKNRDVFQVFYFVKCSNCKKSTKVDPDSKQKPVCSYCDSVLKKTETNFFVTIPMEQQIRQSVKDNWNYISQFNTNGNSTGVYSDAHDGKILKSLLEQYKDSDVNILSLCLNLDGANKFKSNKMSLWPLQFLQNYLPPSIRFQTRNIIVGGFYYGSTKLCCREYLLPLISELNHLKRNNMKMTIDDVDYTFKPVVTHCAVDLPAKSMLQETKQFGSYDGCTYCEIPGELVKVKTKKQQNKKNAKKNQKVDNDETYKENKFVRYVEGKEPYKLRDENDTLKQMLAAAKSNNKTAVNGIKDVSCLVGLEHFNIVHSFAVEYMHCSLLGVQKRLLNYFLNPNFSKHNFYIKNEKKKLLNARILSIKPPSYIVRKPRSMEQRAYFKASEYRSLLLYYLPVCLQGLIPNAYVKHVQRFSAAMYILLKERISDEDVTKAENMLNVFVKEHQILFGKEAMVMVVHLLIHISESVRQLGPLWCQSAFPFERNNGCLLKLVRGTSDVLLQVSNKYALSKTLVKKKERPNIPNKILLGRKVKFVEKVLYVYNIESGKTLNFSNISMSVHLRIRLGKIIYTSLLYTRPKRTINYFIGLKDETFGMAMFYFEYDKKIYVLIREFESIDNIHHILKIKKANRILMAPINDIAVKYLYMKIGLNEYVATEPNSYENE